MPPPPPLQYESSGPAAAQATPPPPLLTAVRLMYVGAALSAIFLIIGLAQADSLRDQIADDQPELSADELDAAVAIGTAFAVIIGLISVGLWIWMAVMNRKGRSWARVVATVLGGLNIVFTLIGLTQNTGIGTIVNLISIVLAAAILWLLYRPESSAYYAAMSGPRR
jgi:sorbitol-specific phosphotransferase system component IIBC